MDTNTIDRRSLLKLGSVGVAASAVTGAGGSEPSSESKPGATEKPGPVYRTLGRTGLKVSVVGAGAMRTSEPAVLQAAFDRGVNFVHTGRRYMNGNNERIVGKALKGYRDKVYVATKVPGKSKEQMIGDVETSLKTLDVDYVDVLTKQGVSSRAEVLNEEIIEAMVQVRDQGKARFLAVPTHRSEGKELDEAIDALIESKVFDVVLVTYNFMKDKSVKDAIARAAKAGIGVVAMKTQAGGYETKELGDISPHQAALKWVLQDPNVATTIPAMVNLDQVKEDTEVMGMKLSTVDKQILTRYGDAIRPYYCMSCGKCEATCPKGVDIPTVNRCLMYAEGYRDLDLARSTYAELPTELSVAACRDCTECVAKCVHGLDIAAKIRTALTVFA